MESKEKNVSQDNANQDQANQDQADQDQANQDQANQDQANQDQADQDQANQDQANQDQKLGKREAEIEENTYESSKKDENSTINENIRRTSPRIEEILGSQNSQAEEPPKSESEKEKEKEQQKRKKEKTKADSYTTSFVESVIEAVDTFVDGLIAVQFECEKSQIESTKAARRSLAVALATALDYNGVTEINPNTVAVVQVLIYYGSKFKKAYEQKQTATKKGRPGRKRKHPNS